MVNSSRLSQNNKGYSLVELIIVIAIMAALTGTIVFSISLIMSSDAKGCAHSLVSALADTKVNAMGREGAYLELKRDSDGNIWCTQYVNKGGTWNISGQAQKIGTRRTFISFFDATSEVTNGGGTELTEDAGSLFISFDRSSGSYRESGSGPSGVTYKYYAGFEIIGGSKDYLVTLHKLTGKTEINS